MKTENSKIEATETPHEDMSAEELRAEIARLEKVVAQEEQKFRALMGFPPDAPAPLPNGHDHE